MIKQTKGSAAYSFPVDFSGAAFSADSRWAAFVARPGPEEEKKLRAAKKKVYNKVCLVNLRTGEKTEFDRIRSFSFSAGDSSWIALHTYPPENQKDWAGTDLILHELLTSKEINIGNVSEYAFDRTGEWLAWIIDAQDENANGIQLRNMKRGTVLPLDSGRAVYSKLTWTDEGKGLAVLKGKKDPDYKDRLHSVVGFKNYSEPSPRKVVYDPLEDQTFPEGMTVSPHRAPSWTDDLQGLLFGIHPKEKKPDEEKEESVVEKEDLPDLIPWHWLDDRLPPRQKIEEKMDREWSFLSVYWVDDKKFIRLADDAVKDVAAAPGHRWAIGLDERQYLYMSTLDGREYNDIYVIDMKSGDRHLAVEKCREFRRPRWFYTPSPDGTHFLYYDNKEGHFFTYDMANRRQYNITKDVPTSFVNTLISYNQRNPVIRPYGWAKDGQSVLLYDNWNVWKVPIHGGGGVNLTVNGKKDSIRYKRLYFLDFDRRSQQNVEERGIDLSRPVYFEAYGEWTKKEGIALIDNGRPGVKMLLWDDAQFSSFFKAKTSETYFYVRETHDDLGYYVTDSSFQRRERILGPSPEKDEFLWSGGSLLIDYKSPKGERLQACLFLPAGYEKGKSYPTLVQIYERRSDRLHRYLYPAFTDWNRPFYTSRGYALLEPDIVFELNNSGMSAVECVLAAVETAAATGIVERDRLGLMGHSWGGYETAFIITQTDLFKAVVAGAPPTDLISQYSTVYGSTGDANSRWFESSQLRFKGGYWEYFEDYVRNSPVFSAPKVKTPLIILSNDKDKAVDFNQGVEYFNTLRRLYKLVIMLQYQGEGHSLSKFPNRMDYFIRVQEFFEHYLMGKPTPEWLKKGISLLQMDDHLRKRVKEFGASEIHQ